VPADPPEARPPTSSEALRAPDGPPSAAASAPGIPRWARWTGAVAVLLVVLVVAGSLVHLPYYTLSPGSSVDVNQIVHVRDGQSYPSRGEVLLLFVRQRSRINVWRWVQAKLDSEIDLYKQQTITGGLSPAELEDRDRADMAISKFTAKAVAFEHLDGALPIDRPGVRVLWVYRSYPAASALEPDDVVVAVDGKAVSTPEAVANAVRARKPGDDVTITYLRDGRRHDARLRTVANESGQPIVGISVVPRYRFPSAVTIDTGNIQGPSAGLAMTLAVIDELTPGDLTGGKKIAVTGTIEPDGSVGQVGGVAQKSVAVRAAHPALFLVPAQEAADARKHSGGVKVVGVRDLAGALRALRSIGGAPVPTTSTTTLATAA